MTEAIAIGESEVEMLWETFKVFDQDGNNTITITELEAVMAELGLTATSPQSLAAMIRDVDTSRSGTIDRDEFRTMMLAWHGSERARLELAFSVFDQDGSGSISEEELRVVMAQFGLSDADLRTLIMAVDSDGDGRIDCEEFCRILLSRQSTPQSATAAPSTAKPPGITPTPATATARPYQRLEEQRAAGGDQHSLQQNTEASGKRASQRRQGRAGSSRLQMRIGLFRLIQGAAYRCFRESFSANHETHLRVRNLPYRITDFVEFVDLCMQLYKNLGIVEPACHPALDDVSGSIRAEYERLQQRIQNWPSLSKTAEMQAEAEAMLASRANRATALDLFAAGVEYAISLKKTKLELSDVAEGVLALQELNRLRHADVGEDLVEAADAGNTASAADYLNCWHRVILEDGGEAIDGAMMPTAYWYEDFMPKLLRAFTVETAADMAETAEPDPASLNDWHADALSRGEFSRFGGDVAEGFSRCEARVKMSLKQAWQLSKQYLNGLQKRRERLEFGRDSGSLSHYVAFMDVYLGRSDVRDTQMRVSFPYYIGPAVWRFLHTTAEIISGQAIEQQATSIALFKTFFSLFARLYPCPYCRHHLNAYVVQNREVDLYPLEYLYLGKQTNHVGFQLSLQDKLDTVLDGPSLRLFLWKLHNTVSASIARTEEWYRRDQKAFYTSRYWPSIDSELARSDALGESTLAVERIIDIYAVLKPVALLAGLRLDLQEHLASNRQADLIALNHKAEQRIESLEAALAAGSFLQDSYRFDPSLLDEDPAFSPEEEAFSRTNLFIEV